MSPLNAGPLAEAADHVEQSLSSLRAAYNAIYDGSHSDTEIPETTHRIDDLLIEIDSHTDSLRFAVSFLANESQNPRLSTSEVRRGGTAEHGPVHSCMKHHPICTSQQERNVR